MKQQTDRSPVSGALPPPGAVNLSQVPGCQARRAVTGLLFFYAAFDLFTTCESLHLSVSVSFKWSTRSGSASTTKPNTMPPTNSRRCCQVMPAPMSIAETITSSVAILFFKMVPLLFCLLPEQQGDRWCGPRCLSMVRVDELRPRIHMETRPALFRIKLRIASTLRHETVLSTMNALFPFSSNRLLLDHRLSVRQVGVCLPFRDHSKTPAGPKRSDHRFALARRLFSE